MVAVGPGFRHEDGSYTAPCVNVGDIVLLPEYGGSKVDLDKEVRAVKHTANQPFLFTIVPNYVHRVS